MPKNKDLQNMLTSFEKEVGHIKEWQIDLKQRASMMASDAGLASKAQKKGIHSYTKDERKKIASKAGKVRGSIMGKVNVENGHWAKCHQLAKEACYIPVLQCDKKTGEVIKEWKAAKIAADELKISYTALNNNLQGLSKSFCGFIWKYKE